MLKFTLPFFNKTCYTGLATEKIEVGLTMMKKRVIGVLLTVVMSLSVVLSVSASTQEQITNAKAEQEAAEAALAETQNEITDLESKKSELENYLTDLNKQLTDLDASLTDIQSEIEAKEVELERLQAALGRAKEQEAKQYEEMKLRIRYMYENSSTTLLESLFSSNSIAEFLNRAETISQISEYDREQLDTYKATKASIEEREQAIFADKEVLLQLKSESEQKQAEIAALATSTDAKISEYASIISQEEMIASDLQAQISEQTTLLQHLEEKAAEEQRKAEQEAARQATIKAAEEQRVEDEQEAIEAGKIIEEERAEQERLENAIENGTYLGNFKLTAYCACSSCCGQWAGGATASGTTPTAGRTVAMAGVPFGTKLLINGTVYTVEDRGTPYGHVDIFFDSHSAALSFGRQYADVYQINY